MNVIDIVAAQSDTLASNWEHTSGPETGVGSEYWLVNETDGLQAYVCIDQGELTECSVYEMEEA